MLGETLLSPRHSKNVSDQTSELCRRHLLISAIIRELFMKLKESQS